MECVGFGQNFQDLKEKCGISKKSDSQKSVTSLKAQRRQEEPDRDRLRQEKGPELNLTFDFLEKVA